MLSNGFTVGALSAIALHLMIPFNAEEDSAPSHDDVLPATATDNHLYKDVSKVLLSLTLKALTAAALLAAAKCYQAA